MGTCIVSPACTTRGKERTLGTRNCGFEEVMLVMTRAHAPELLMERSRSLNVPRQTSPKLPLSAMKVAMMALVLTAVAVRSTNGEVGSLLTIRMVACWGPGKTGLYSTVNS